MSEPTGRPDEPETAALPVTEPTAQWAVASTGHPQTQPLMTGGAGPAAGSGGTGGAGEPARVPAGAAVGSGAAGAPGGLPGETPTVEYADWHSGAPVPGPAYGAGTLPPGPDGWGRQDDLLTNGPQGGARRRIPLGLAAAGGAVLIAGAAFAAGLAVGNHSDRLENTSAGARFGAPGAGQGQQGLGQQGQQGQGQQGQSQPGQQGQGQGQFGGAPNGGQLPEGIGRLVAAGVITEVRGSTLIVQGRSGPVTVTTSGSTRVEADLGGSVGALQPGELIFVAGTVADDGTVTALAIADRPFFAGIPGNRGQNGSDGNGQNGNGQNGDGQNGNGQNGDGQDGTDGQNTSGPGQGGGSGITT